MDEISSWLKLTDYISYSKKQTKHLQDECIISVELQTNFVFGMILFEIMSHQFALRFSLKYIGAFTVRITSNLKNNNNLITIIT